MIDFRSDTVTRPTEQMRDAARDATVGDDKRDGDPTVRELEEHVAERLGMSAGLFVPSGTMGNQVAIHVHTQPGQEVIVDRQAHVYNFEFGDLALLSQLQVRPLDAAPDGCLPPSAIEDAVAERSQWPGAGLVTLENTHNQRGGVAVEAAAIDAAATTAHDLGLPVHLDGARLANAAVALDCSLAAFTGHVDSVMFDLSKGLGAPVGAVLVGEADFIEEARNVRNAFGGGMRQAGMVAAPALPALENVDRLAEDHENAALLADRLEEATNLVAPSPDTNILFVDTEPTGVVADDLTDRLLANDIRAQPVGEYAIRFCTHRDVSRADVERTVELLADVL